jgi:RNA recognition motif-containing protein
MSYETSEKKYDPLKVFIGNLSYQATDDDIMNFFKEKADVDAKSVRILHDRETNRSRGYGFAEFETAEQSSAVQALNGMDFMGRQIKITPAEQRDATKKPFNKRPFDNNSRRSSY